MIRTVVMMYVKFPLSLRNVEDMLAERGIDICHETVRLWWNRFGPMFAPRRAVKPNAPCWCSRPVREMRIIGIQRNPTGGWPTDHNLPRSALHQNRALPQR